MKKFTTKLCCLALAAMLVTACSSDEKMSTEVTQEAPEIAVAIPTEEALDNLETYLGYVSTRSPKEIPSVGDVLLFQSETRAGEAGEAYIVNFKDGGYAILGANTAQDPIIAFIEEGSMTPEKLMADLNAAKSGAESDFSLINARVASYILETVVGTEMKTTDRTRGTGLEVQDALMATNWKTGALKADKFTLAIAQIIAHNAWRHNMCPATINNRARPWGPIITAAQKPTLDGVNIFALDALFSDISVQILYPEGTSNWGKVYTMLQNTDCYRNVKSTLLSHFYTGTIDYDYQIIREMIVGQKKPIYISLTTRDATQNDGYVLDGWIQVPLANGSLSITAHHNFGNAQQTNGMYALSISGVTDDTRNIATAPLIALSY